MGAGIVPATIHNGKLYFLFGKENKYADTPGYSDFGGGQDNGESFFKTAVREGGEELTGFLGSDKDLIKMLKKHGTYNIEWTPSGHKPHRIHIFPMDYDEALVHYYNNNQRFIQTHLDPEIIKRVKIFEKAEIKWFSMDELKKKKKEFRSFFQNIVDLICDQQDDIHKFIKKAHKSTTNNSKKKTRKNR